MDHKLDRRLPNRAVYRTFGTQTGCTIGKGRRLRLTQAADDYGHFWLFAD